MVPLTLSHLALRIRVLLGSVADSRCRHTTTVECRSPTSSAASRGAVSAAVATGKSRGADCRLAGRPCRPLPVADFTRLHPASSDFTAVRIASDRISALWSPFCLLHQSSSRFPRQPSALGKLNVCNENTRSLANAELASDSRNGTRFSTLANREQRKKFSLCSDHDFNGQKYIACIVFL